MRSSEVEISSPLVPVLESAPAGDNIWSAHEEGAKSPEKDYKYPTITSSYYNTHICVCLLIIGIMFTWASAEFLFSISNFQVGGWLFVVASVLFLYVDVMNWWINNRVGCCCYSDKYEASYENHVQHFGFDPSSTIVGKLQRAENGIIGGIAIIASLAFTIGSIMFLPSIADFEGAILIFIIGSAVIFVVQLWLVIKHRDDTLLCSLHCCGSGCGLFYLIGSVWFMPEFNTTAFDTNGAAGFFIVGGICFLIVGMLFSYRLFFESALRVSFRESVVLAQAV